MKKILLLVAAFAVPALASAHTRWFLDGEPAPLQITEPTALYLGIWAAIAAVVVGIGIYLHQRNLWRLSFLRPKAGHAYERAASTFTMVVGAFFLIAGTHEYLFSPNVSYESGLPYVLIVAQISIGLALMLGIMTRVAAIALALVWLCSLFFTGWVAALENIWVLSTAAFIAVMGNDYFSLVSSSALRDKFQMYKEYALSFLRLGTGFTLLTLGFSEKILNPEFGINFLAQHDWNFMQSLGFEFSNYLFVLSAGAVESLFGLVFILGVVTRLNALIVAIVFTIPLFILGPIELAGHMPHFAAVVLLLLFGSGGHFLLFKKYEDAKVAQA
ncbi:MAG: DoxX family membrane protein [Candidatus Pacebacteria bacterium]|nr:DoxX family membrane protein [Candidatus Paceibacterota bacterium]